MAEERTVLLKLEVDNDKAQQQLESNAAQIEINRKELKDLNKSYKDGSISVQEYSKRKLQLSNSNKELGRENRRLVKQLDAEENSLNALRASLSQLTAERNATNQATEKGRRRFEALQREIKDTTDAIKEQEQAGGDFRRNVGNYGDALRSNIPLLDEYAMKLESFKGGLMATVQGLKGTTTGLSSTSKALRIFKIALVSTGVGAIVVALGSLITFLTSTQRGIDAVTKVTRPLAQIFQRLIGVVQDLGGDAFDALGEAIQNPIQALKDLGSIIVENIINRFEALSIFGEAVSELFSGEFSNAAKLAADASIQLSTGIEDGTNKLINAGKQIKEFGNDAIDAGTKIDNLTKAIELQEIALIKLSGTNERISEQSREIAEDQSKDIEIRIKNARRALAAESELEQARIAQLNRRIELLTLQQDANDTSREDLKELAELEAQRDEASARAAGRRTSINNLLNTLLKEQNSELEKQKQLEQARKDQNQLQLENERAASAERIGIRQNEAEEVQRLQINTIEAKRRAEQAITESQRQQSQIRAEIQAIENETIQQSIGALAGSLAGVFEQNTIAYKTFASIDAAISTYVAINKALATLGPIAGPISAVGIGIQGFANVAKINGLIGGGNGAGARGRQADSTNVGPRIGRTTLGGAFDRGQLTRQTRDADQQSRDVQSALQNAPAPIVKVTDINKSQKNKKQVTVKSSL